MTKLDIGVIEVGDEAAEALKRRAATSGRSIPDLAAELISQSVGGTQSKVDWLKRIEEIAAMTPKDVVQSDSTEILREIRGE